MSTSNIWILVAFVAYMSMMIVVGVIYSRSSKNAQDYFLGGRGLNGWFAALSAQASDMSGWLLMGLPGAIYALGTGEVWIAVGLFIGTVLNWLFISKRLYRYTIRANNSMTLPEYFTNRFHDEKKILLAISSVIIVIFFLVYTASAFASGAKLFNVVFGTPYHIALLIGAGVILLYTFLGGFLAVCATDFIQGLLMIVALVTIPIAAYFIIGGENIAAALDASGVAGGAASFMDPLQDGGKPVTAISIISNLAWGLGYCGMPHILVRFMAVKNETELKKSKAIGIIWCFISLVFACIIGVVGRAYLYASSGLVLGDNGTSSENVFIQMITFMFNNDIAAPLIGGIFICGILAAIMSTADSQLLVASASMSQDLIKGVFKKDAKDSQILVIGKITVVCVAIIAFFIAWDPNNSIMGLVSNAWAGLGAAFGPTVLMSLYWKRTNMQGAFAGMVSGALAVIIWDYIPLAGGQTLGKATGLYSLLIGFALSIFCIVVVSLVTKKPSEAMEQEFADAASEKNLDEYLG